MSRELASARSQTITDVRYDLSLDVTARDSAPGLVTVSFRRSGNTDAILDFRGRRLGEVVVNGTPLAAPSFNGAHLVVPAAFLRPGENSVRIAFVADIAPTGASIIRSTDRTDGNDYLYTLLVPADANQLFPCFDQPDLKARVSFTLRAPASWTVVANGLLLRTDTAAAMTHHFAETKPLSTYLIAFAAGPWHRASSTVNGRTINVFVRESRAKEADLDTLLALNHRALGWMERYFDRAYPFDKYDFVLAPAFPFGGMEHPGAVFYNEDRFIFRERPTLPRVLGRYSTILHEVAHQWFGDLVTMQWFDDLWLKEGFATYMAAKALDDLEPASQAWKTFYLSNKPAAYGVDQTMGTTPLWQSLANLDQAKSNYGAIVYNKAPAVLKQLNYLVGDTAFQRGVQQFLSGHAYANATWRDLLASVGQASRRDLTAWGEQWMLRPGMPEVQARLAMSRGRIERLQLAQRPVQESVSGKGSWPLKTQLVVVQGPARCDSACLALAQRGFAAGEFRTFDIELRGPLTDVPGARGLANVRFVYANSRDFGYQLVSLDQTSRAALLAGALPTIGDPMLRAMLWGTLWDEVRAARLHPAGFVSLVTRDLPRETDEQSVPTQLGRLSRAMNAYLVDAARDSLLPRVEEFLWHGAGDTSRVYGIRRAYLDAFVSVSRTPAALDQLRRVLAADSAAGDAVKDPLRWEIVTHLTVLGATDAGAKLAAQMARDSTPDGRRRAFTVGAAQGNSATKSEYFRRYFADSTLNEDWASGSLGAFNSIEHQAITRAYLRPALDSLPFIQANRRIFFLGSWLGAFLNGQTAAAALDLVQDFLRDHPSLPLDLRQKVLQNADELARTVRIRAEFGRTLEQ